MSSYMVEYEITQRYRVSIKVAADEGSQEALEEFWQRWHHDDESLNVYHYQNDGPQNVQVYRG
jgi:hypothetical protein